MQLTSVSARRQITSLCLFKGAAYYTQTALHNLGAVVQAADTHGIMWMNYLENDPNARFEKAIFDLLRDFNFIDLNLGLCISFFASNNDPQSTYKKLASMSFEQRMKWFEKSLHSEQKTLNKKSIGEFNKWLIDADQARKLRNIYANAIWRFYPDILSTSVNLTFYIN